MKVNSIKVDVPRPIVPLGRLALSGRMFLTLDGLDSPAFLILSSQLLVVNFFTSSLSKKTEEKSSFIVSIDNPFYKIRKRYN